MGMAYFPVEEASSKIDFKKKYEEAIQMAESASSTREQIAALTKVIALKSAEAPGRSRPPLLKTQMLPSHLLKSFDFGVSDISFEEHIEQLEDFLMNQPDDDFTKTGFLLMSLEGATASSFRTVLKRDRKIKYADAISFLQSASHSRDSRKDLFKQMEGLKQQSGERMDNFLSRAA
eukprot:SAG11_NODE_127_length_15677_cov_10.890872_7_plen_176_part_00